jgi:hypothetical protein
MQPALLSPPSRPLRGDLPAVSPPSLDDLPYTLSPFALMQRALKKGEDIPAVLYAAFPPAYKAAWVRLRCLDASLQPRALRVLESMLTCQKLTSDDIVFMKNTGVLRPPVLRQAYHRHQAGYFERLHKKRGGCPWSAASACRHYRKAGHPERGKHLIEGLLSKTAFGRRVYSSDEQCALWTTLGGVYRTLGASERARDCALRAHALSPLSFHPCSLLGILAFEEGDLVCAREWKAKAIARGCPGEQVDRDFLLAFMQLKNAQKEAYAASLASDPAWAALKEALNSPPENTD